MDDFMRDKFVCDRCRVVLESDTVLMSYATIAAFIKEHGWYDFPTDRIPVKVDGKIVGFEPEDGSEDGIGYWCPKCYKLEQKLYYGEKS